MPAKPKPRKKVKSPQVKKKGSSVSFEKYLPFILLAAILIFFSVIRIRLLSFPLERDEGEYAYFGQLILQGIAPFKLAFNLKLPGTYYMYALMMGIFGQTNTGVHLGLMFFNLGSLVFVFLIGRKLFNNFVAISAVAVFAVLTLSPTFLGARAHATHFVTFFMLAGVYLLLVAFEKKRWFYYLLSGLLLGSSFIMKQSGLFFPLFGGLMILLYPLITKKIRFTRGVTNLLIYGAGAVVPLALVFLVMYSNEVFDRFWFWTFVYPKVYGSKIPVSEVFGMLSITMPPLFRSFIPLWVLAALGIPALFFYPRDKWVRIFIGLFLLFSILPALPGFYFRQHYFIPLIPALGFMAAVALDTVNLNVEKHFRQIRWLTALLLIILIATGLNTNKDYYFKKSISALTKRYYFGNPFQESIPIAKYIKAHTGPDDAIFVFGSEPQIYFLSARKSATGYIYMYDLVFDHPYVKQMQNEMMERVSEAKPEYVVFVNITYSWNVQPEISDTLFKWFNRFITDNNYTISGIVELHTPKPSVYVWDEEARKYPRQSDKFVILFSREK